MTTKGGPGSRSIPGTIRVFRPVRRTRRRDRHSLGPRSQNRYILYTLCSRAVPGGSPQSNHRIASRLRPRLVVQVESVPNEADLSSLYVLSQAGRRHGGGMIDRGDTALACACHPSCALAVACPFEFSGIQRWIRLSLFFLLSFLPDRSLLSPHPLVPDTCGVRPCS